MLNAVPYKKYHAVRGSLKTTYVTCNYMYVTYDLNYDVTRYKLLR